MKVIRGKLRGRKPRLQERETPQSAAVVDLMARLRASLEGTSAPRGKAASSASRGRKKTVARMRNHAA